MTYINRIAFITILAGAMALPAVAQQRELPRQPPGESMHGMMQGGMMGMMAPRGDAAGRERPQLTLALQNRTELGLTEPQGKTLESLVERFRSSAEQRMRELESAESQLASLLEQDPAAGPQVEAEVRRIEKLRADLRLERIRTIAEGRAALAPEQRAKLDCSVYRASRRWQSALRSSGSRSRSTRSCWTPIRSEKSSRISGMS